MTIFMTIPIGSITLPNGKKRAIPLTAEHLEFNKIFNGVRQRVEHVIGTCTIRALWSLICILF